MWGDHRSTATSGQAVATPDLHGAISAACQHYCALSRYRRIARKPTRKLSFPPWCDGASRTGTCIGPQTLLPRLEVGLLKRGVGTLLAPRITAPSKQYRVTTLCVAGAGKQELKFEREASRKEAFWNQAADQGIQSRDERMPTTSKRRSTYIVSVFLLLLFQTHHLEAEDKTSSSLFNLTQIHIPD